MRFQDKLRYTLIVPAVVSVSIVMALALLVAFYSREHEAQVHMLQASQETMAALLTSQEYILLQGDDIESCGYAEDGVSKLYSQDGYPQVRFISARRQEQVDSSEKEVLDAFVNNPDMSEHYERCESEAGQNLFRYSVPVRWEDECVRCHETAISNDVAGVYTLISLAQSHDDAAIGYALYDISFSLFLAVVCVVSLWVPLRRRVTKPIEQFAASTSKINDSTLDIRLDANRIGATGELKNLIDCFNEMIANLQSSYDSVEAKVRQRTEELSSAMEELSIHKQEVDALNEQLKEESAYKSDFLAIISHELKTPLSSMLANIRFLRSEQHKEEEIEALDDIERNGDALLTLINQILDAARLDTGHAVIEEDVVDAIDLTNAAVSTFAPIASDKEVVFDVSVSDDFPLVLADADKLEKIIRNLVSNAIKFTPAKGHVGLSLTYCFDEETIYIVTEDSGIGLKGVDLSRIFDRFYQGDRSETRAYGGTGIGLSLVKEFTELMGGSVRVIDLGCGARFEVTIPAHFIKGE